LLDNLAWLCSFDGERIYNPLKLGNMHITSLKEEDKKQYIKPNNTKQYIRGRE